MQQLPHNHAPNRVEEGTQPPNQTGGDTAADYLQKGVKYGDVNEKPRGTWDLGDWNFAPLILSIVAIGLILFLASVIIPDLAEAVIDTIRYFKRLFKSPRFYPRPNEAFVQIALWTAFVCFVIWCVKGWMNRRK